MIYFILDNDHEAPKKAEEDGSSVLHNAWLNAEPVEYKTGLGLVKKQVYYIDLDVRDSGRSVLTRYTKGNIENLDRCADISKREYQQVSAVFKIEENDQSVQLLFQKVWPSHKIQSRFIILFELEPELKKISDSITLTEGASIILDVDAKRIYFQSFRTLSAVFPILKDYYRIASEAEVNHFKSKLIHSVVLDPSAMQYDKIGELNKKNIAKLLDNPSLFRKIIGAEFDKWKAYSEESNCKIPSTGNKFDVSKNSDLTNLLKLFDEVFYEGKVTGEKKEAGS